MYIIFTHEPIKRLYKVAQSTSDSPLALALDASGRATESRHLCSAAVEEDVLGVSVAEADDVTRDGGDRGGAHVGQTALKPYRGRAEGLQEEMVQHGREAFAHLLNNIALRYDRSSRVDLVKRAKVCSACTDIMYQSKIMLVIGTCRKVVDLRECTAVHANGHFKFRCLHFAANSWVDGDKRAS